MSEQTGDLMNELTFHHIKCERQPAGSNLCGYFVSEWIRSEVSERNPTTFVQVLINV